MSPDQERLERELKAWIADRYRECCPSLPPRPIDPEETP